MATYRIAIEGGGTRSTCSVINASLEEVYEDEGPPLHAHRMSIDTLISRIKNFVEEVRAGSGVKFNKIQGIGLALAGAGRSDEQQIIRKALSEVYSRMNILVSSDVRATHVGAFSNSAGILVIAGTGSIVLGRKGRTWKRAGGYGHRMGDEGSGHQIGVDGLRAVGRHYDEMESTSLTRKMEEEFDITSRDKLIKWTYEADHSPSRIAPYVIECAREGDRVCQSILDSHQQQLADMVRSLTESLSLPEGPASWHGGLFDSDYYLDQFKTRLQSTIENLQFVSPQYNPRIGVCLMM